jgi:hypothetical protein
VTWAMVFELSTLPDLKMGMMKVPTSQDLMWWNETQPTTELRPQPSHVRLRWRMQGYNKNPAISWKTGH